MAATTQERFTGLRRAPTQLRPELVIQVGFIGWTVNGKPREVGQAP